LSHISGAIEVLNTDFKSVYVNRYHKILPSVTDQRAFWILLHKMWYILFRRSTF